MVTSYTLPDTSGSGIHAFRFARFINKQGDKASLLTFNRNCRFPAKETIENVTVFRIPYFNKGIIMKLLSLPIVIFYFILYVLKTECVFIYGGKIFAWQLLTIISGIFREKIVFQSLLEGVDDLNSIILSKTKIYQVLYKVLLKKVHVYYSLNRSFTHQYFEIFRNKERLLTVPQGVDTSEFHPLPAKSKLELRQRLNLPHDIPLILAVGFLIRRKGYNEIFTQLVKLDFDFRFIVLGEYDLNSNHFLIKHQSEMDEIYELGKNLLGNKIIFTGFKENVSEYLQCSEYFLMNSIQEGLPNALLEAMASGVPVITRNLKGINDYITLHGQNAMVYDHPDEIPGMIRFLHENPKERDRIAENALKDTRKKFSFKAVYPQLLKKLFS